MHSLNQMLSPDRVLRCHSANNRSSALRFVANHVAKETGVPLTKLLEDLLRRERDGSTAIGGGVAIPRITIDIDVPCSVWLVRLDTPVPYDAPDKRPVDITALVVAGRQHRSLGGLVVRRLHDIFVRTYVPDAIRSTNGASAVLRLIIDANSTLGSDAVRKSYTA